MTHVNAVEYPIDGSGRIEDAFSDDRAAIRYQEEISRSPIFVDSYIDPEYRNKRLKDPKEGRANDEYANNVRMCSYGIEGRKSGRYDATTHSYLYAQTEVSYNLHRSPDNGSTEIQSMHRTTEDGFLEMGYTDNNWDVSHGRHPQTQTTNNRYYRSQVQ